MSDKEGYNKVILKSHLTINQQTNGPTQNEVSIDFKFALASVSGLSYLTEEKDVCKNHALHILTRNP